MAQELRLHREVKLRIICIIYQSTHPEPFTYELNYETNLLLKIPTAPIN